MKEKRERNIGNLFVSIRKMMGLSQMEVAEKSHVTRQNISRIELGRYSPGVDVIQRIEDALGIERIYITKNNIIMAESVSFILGATDVQELHNPSRIHHSILLKQSSCLSIVQLSGSMVKLLRLYKALVHLLLPKLKIMILP